MPLVQSAINNARSPARAHIEPVTAFTGRDPTPLIREFICSVNMSSVTVYDAQLEHTCNINALMKKSTSYNQSSEMHWNNRENTPVL